MGERKSPEPGGGNAEILLDLAHRMGLAGVKGLVESCGAAVQVHEQCQGAAGAGCSPAERELGTVTGWEMQGPYQQGCGATAPERCC